MSAVLESTVPQVLFCGLKREITAKMCLLCFVQINNILHVVFCPKQHSSCCVLS